jgi:hypothetical protein
MDICEPHRKYLFLYIYRRCITTENIRLLPAYSLSWECVYQVVAQQRVYVSQYNQVSTLKVEEE